MNKRSFIFTLTAVAVISICMIVVTFLAKNEMDSIKKLYADMNDRQEVQLLPQSTLSDGERTRKEEEEETTGQGIVKRDFGKYVFVGDSRYKGMAFMAGEEDMFICESGRGYDFLLEQMWNIRYACDENTALIVGLGVNDNTYNFEKYIQTLNEMAESMDCQIYYMLVNPVDEAKESYSGYDVKNENIDIFNENIQLGLDESIGIIDTNSYLKEVEFDTMDGLHYTDDTYEKIYHFIKNEISGAS